jgi:hypothetical protein
MAIITNTVETFDRTNIPENVASKKLYYFEREETPLLSTSSKVKATSTTVEWTEDSLVAAAGNNHKVEGDAFTVEARPQVVRKQNYTQIFDKVYSVTGTSQAVDSYGYNDQMAHERTKALREIKRDIEKALVENNPSVAGATGTPRELGGLETWISTNASRGVGGAGTGYNSGTKLTAAPTDGTQRPLTQNLFDDLIKTSYDNGIDVTGTRYLMANSNIINQVASTFTGNQSRMSTDATKVSNKIDMILTPFGIIATKLNPQMRQRTAIVCNPEHFTVAVLRDFKTTKLAKTSDSEEEALVYEATSVVREKGHAVLADINT